MKKIFFTVFISTLCYSVFAQRTTENDGDWSKQLLLLKNTKEAALMIRVGDIDNLGFGFDEDFNPFSGQSTAIHNYPWDIKPEDAGGTDRIMIPTSYKYGIGNGADGYAGSTQRPDNIPYNISIPLAGIKGMKVDSAALQLFIDDFQSPYMESKFQVRINGLRFTEAEKMINSVNQSGPNGKLITLRLTPELLQKLNADSLVLAIDDPTTKIGDGYAVDFVKLLINPNNIYFGSVQGRIIDKITREPIPHATASVEDHGSVTSDAEGKFILNNVPAGLNIVKGSAAGYSSGIEQVDVIASESSEDVELELGLSGTVIFNNQTFKEGDNLVMKNIQFGVSSAVLLAAGKTELDKLAALMKQNSSIEILLSGHTSSEGSSLLNRELSLKRVRSCKDYLTSKGIDDGRIRIKGFGPDMPIAPNDNETNRAINRRVEMQITKL